jgi:coenzyme F420-dependent glucose-6-phosphate dehydrogenase
MGALRSDGEGRVIIGYHASHEQFSPSDLLRFVRKAEDAGFGAVMTSDHIAPWSERQGNSGNNWAWLGAALSSTSIPFGSLAIPGGWRYHPVVLAHLVATLADMFPNRLRWVALGSGEAMNETVVGADWPDKSERSDRLGAGADIMRRLFRGEIVDARYPWFSAEKARLWSLPDRIPAMFGAALTPQTATALGRLADGLLTVRKPVEELRNVVESFRASGGRDKPLALQLQIAWGPAKDDARRSAWDQWRCAALSAKELADTRQPSEFDRLTQKVSLDAMNDCMVLIDRGEDLIAEIQRCAGCGFDEIYIHNVSRDQESFIKFMGTEVLPAL